MPIGEAISQGLADVLGQHYKERVADRIEKQNYQRDQSRLQEAFGEAQKIFNDPNLEPEQKQFGLTRVLSMYPQLAKMINDQEQATAERKQEQKKLDQKQEVLDQVFGKKGTPQQPMSRGQLPEEELPSGPGQQGTKPPELETGYKPPTQQQILGMSLVDKDLAKLSQKQAEAFEKKEAEVGKRFQEAYDYQKPFIDKVTGDYISYVKETKPRLDQMSALNEKDLVTPTAATFLEALGIPLGAIDNPQSEAFDKLSNDLLKGLPDTYGNRILKVEVENFLKTIPNVKNSYAGRKIILSNLKKLGEMKEAYYNTMRNEQKGYLSRRQELPVDFEQQVFDNFLPIVSKLSWEFQQLAEIAKPEDVPEGTIPVFDPEGNLTYIRNEDIEKAKKYGGRPAW